MRAGIKQIIGVIILLIVFLFVLMVIVCNVSEDFAFCSTFDPIMDFIDDFIYMG